MEATRKDSRRRVTIADGGSPNKHALAELAEQIEALKAQQAAEFARLYAQGATARLLLGKTGE